MSEHQQILLALQRAALDRLLSDAFNRWGEDGIREYHQGRAVAIRCGKDALERIALMQYQDLVTLTNKIAFEFNGIRGACLLTAHALVEVLKQLGVENARPLRVEAAVFPNAPKSIGTILGAEHGDRTKTAPGKWKGHLVAATDDFLLDATLDQANKQEWPKESHIGPVAIRLNAPFWEDRRTVCFRTDHTTVRWHQHRRQVGFANAPDARPSRWRGLADLILHEWCAAA